MSDEPKQIGSVVLAAEKAATDFGANESDADTMRLVLDVPVEWMRLAAWMYIRGQYRQTGEAQPTLEDPTWSIGRPPTHGHKVKGKRIMHDVLHHWFHETISDLWAGDHPILTELPPAPPEIEPEELPDGLDDEIPF